MIKGVPAVVALLISTIVVIGVSVAFIQPHAIPVDDEFVLDEGETGNYFTGLSLIQITFNQLIEDSRCPIEYACFSAGSVTVEVVVKLNFQKSHHNLTIPNIGTNSRSAVEINGRYQLTLTDVNPYPTLGLDLTNLDYNASFTFIHQQN